MRRRTTRALLALVAGCVVAAAEPVPLPFVSPIFGDHMVLQRGKPNAIWGWSRPGDTVRVEVGGHSATAIAGANGHWLARIEPPPVGGPYAVRIIGRQTVELQDVLVGDVWICAGQSNMQFGLSQATDGPDEIQKASPKIRYFVVGQSVSYTRADVPRGSWKIVSPATNGSPFGGVSAVAYFFARKLHESTRVPIGLVQAAVGGVPAETLASPESLRALRDFDVGLAEVDRRARTGGPEYGNYIQHWYDEHDIGSRNGSWADPELDDSSWKSVPVPGPFEELGVAGVPSLVWLRKVVTLPDTLPQGPARLLLGSVEKMDTTFVNGKQVGASSWVENPRAYFAGGALKPGRNVIAIRLFKMKPDGGFLNPAADLRLALGDGTVIPLGGEWKGRVAVDGRPPQPLPIAFENLPSMPGVLYRGMLEPITPLALTGAIWYQGESNTVRAYQYRRLLPALISGWRKAFGQGDFPFYVVGLPRYKHRLDVPGTDDWAELREAQALTAKTVPHCCLAVTIDTGDPDDVHPKQKRQPGERLAACALAEHYGRKVPWSGPTLASVKRLPGGALKLRFAHADGGLVVRGDKLGEFSLAGDDRKLHWANARIQDDAVIVSAASVPDPKAVRYAWQANPEATLWNGAGLPAAPFRSDDWPGMTEGQPRTTHPGFSFVRLQNGVQVRTDGVTKNVLFYGPGIVRVNANLGRTHTTKPSLAVVAKPAAVTFTVQESPETLSVVSKRLRVVADKKTGALTFFGADGRELTRERRTQPSEIKEVTIAGEPSYEIRQTFTLAPGESLYGLGQYNRRYMDYRGQEVLLVQTNIGSVVPFLVSTRRYGVLWDIYSKMIFKDDAGGATLWAESAPAGVDYYFVAGDTMDGVIAGYRGLTGAAPMFPKAAFGFFMSKERYKTQDRLVEVVRSFRKEGFPIDYIVQDWQYWGSDSDGTWSGMIWDPERFPDPAALTKTLHDELHVKLMNSIWPSVGNDTALAHELDAKGLRFEPLHWISKRARIYDAFSPEGRAIYFKHIKKGLLDVGVDALWMDGTEVEVGGACHDPAGVERDIKNLGRNALGDFTRYLNPYTLMTTKGTYEGQRATSDRRVFTLTRSAWAGQQRYAALPWSGDTSASWETLRDQIAGGINVAMAGLPYWTQDTGGFFVYYPLGEKNPEYQELFARWNQFGAFNPIYRIHGASIEREPYLFKTLAPEIYRSLLGAAQLRYELLPYIYSLAWQSTSNAYTMMRGLPLDFPDDPKVRRTDDAFLFGPAFLVHPVTRAMYHRSDPPPATIPTEALQTPDGRPGLAVQYFAGVDFDKPAGSAIDEQVEHTWPGPPLANPPSGLTGFDNFSARWEGSVTAPEDGEYEFGVEYDDGARLYLDGKLVAEDWSYGAKRYRTAKITLAKDQKLPVKAEFHQGGQERFFRLGWRTPSERRALAGRTTQLDNTVETYLPEGTGWYDFWTGERFSGGRTVKKDCPLDRFPLYVRAGSIVPMGPAMQYATERPDAPYEIRVYPGADARFTIYEDDNETYAYERGERATYDLVWDDAAKTLRIGARQGSFPGMVVARKITASLMTPGGDAVSPAAERALPSVVYTGEPIVLKLTH